MNNLIKTILQNKVIVITGSLVVVVLIGLLAFSSKEEGANVQSNNILNEQSSNTSSDNSNEIVSSRSDILSSYELADDFILYLFKDSSGKFSFIKGDNSVVYETTDNISYFRIFNSNEIVYMSKSLDLSSNRNLSEIKLVNLSDKSEKLLYSGEELHFDVSSNYIYIVNALTGEVKYGDGTNLKSYSLNKKIDKLISNKGRVFAVNYSAVNNNVRSIVYLLDTGIAQELTVTEGKVNSISVDYDNDNLVYYTSKQLDNTIKVYSKFIVNLSASSNGETVYSDLTGSIYSIKDKYLSIDSSTNEILLLNNNLYATKSLGKIHSGSLSSMIKESHNGESLYYIDTKGNVTKL